jgi:hypothetical protein
MSRIQKFRKKLLLPGNEDYSQQYKEKGKKSVVKYLHNVRSDPGRAEHLFHRERKDEKHLKYCSIKC